jgi:hypothetical protein
MNIYYEGIFCIGFQSCLMLTYNEYQYLLDDLLVIYEFHGIVSIISNLQIAERALGMQECNISMLRSRQCNVDV